MCYVLGMTRDRRPRGYELPPGPYDHAPRPSRPPEDRTVLWFGAMVLLAVVLAVAMICYTVLQVFS